jgi:hypothetical protein
VARVTRFAGEVIGSGESCIRIEQGLMHLHAIGEAVLSPALVEWASVN